MPDSLEVSGHVPAAPKQVYDAWLNSKSHAEMTGGGAARASRVKGGKFTVWDGYISGTNLELEPNARIVQAWRTIEFAPSDPDSRLEVLLEAASGGTKVTIRHSNIPDGQGAGYRQGWQDFYLKPMREWFSARGA